MAHHISDSSSAAAAAAAAAASDAAEEEGEDEELAVNPDVSPLSQQLFLDTLLPSALPGESDRKFLNSLSVRKKRRDRMRLQAMLAGDGAAGRPSTTGMAAAAAAPLLMSSAAAAAAEVNADQLEAGLAAAAAVAEAAEAAEDADEQQPPPPPEFGSGDSVAVQQAQAELVLDQIDALPAMVAHMEGRRMERSQVRRLAHPSPVCL